MKGHSTVTLERDCTVTVDSYHDIQMYFCMQLNKVPMPQGVKLIIAPENCLEREQFMFLYAT